MTSPRRQLLYKHDFIVLSEERVCRAYATPEKGPGEAGPYKAGSKGSRRPGSVKR